jgi:hypothetical protein
LARSTHIGLTRNATVLSSTSVFTIRPTNPLSLLAACAVVVLVQVVLIVRTYLNRAGQVATVHIVNTIVELLLASPEGEAEALADALALADWPALASPPHTGVLAVASAASRTESYLVLGG